ncbi:MAG: 50S ribosomal protein L4 [Clostridium sp.]|nr:50S ribosomal protein L4 [Clostridium sp.]
MELKIYNINGTETGRMAELNDQVFGVDINEHAIYLDVKQFLANQRQGTHKSKERSEVSGSTRKLHKQKGGGGSRIGDINSPVLVGGGRVFGPRPRDYRFKLNKKMKQLARKSALTLKAQENQITVVDAISFDEPKTKAFMKMAQDLNVNGKKILVVLPSQNNNVYLSARNVPYAEVIFASDVNTYTLMNHNAILIAEESLDVINKL